jgi:hypothetical protein
MIPLPTTEEAVHQAAILLQAAWIEAAQSGQYMGTNTGAYVRGIQQLDSLRWPLGGDPLRAMVVNTAPAAWWVEYGHPAYHLPERIRWGRTPASRLSKQGVWYLRVPFRHGSFRTGQGMTPLAQRTMLPRHVYQAARRLQPRQRLTTGRSRGLAVHVRGLQPYVPQYAPNIRPGVTHASIHEGLQKRGAKGHSQYMTWRTITQKSAGWHIPRQPGTFIAANVARQMAPIVRRLISAAVAHDVSTAILQSLGRLRR